MMRGAAERKGTSSSMRVRDQQRRDERWYHDGVLFWHLIHFRTQLCSIFSFSLIPTGMKSEYCTQITNLRVTLRVNLSNETLLSLVEIAYKL